MKRTTRANPAALLVVLTLGLTAVEAAAKTTYVEKFGADDFVCARSAPCETIQHAIDTAGARGRVIVGPGTYDEQISIVEDNVRVISAAGADATIIDSTAAACPLGGSAMVCLQGDGAVFGQKNRGFTVTGDFGGVNGLQVDGDRARIESNTIRDENENNDDAIELNGAKAAIRYNTIQDFNWGIWGLQSSVDNPRHQVVANRFLDINVICIYIQNDLNGNNRVRDNAIVGCGSSAIDLRAATGSRSNNRVQNNLIKDALFGYDAGFTNGDQVKSNLFVDIGDDVIRIYGTVTNLVFSNNTAMGTGGSDGAIYFYPGVGPETLRQFANNNIGFDTGCAISFGGPIAEGNTYRFSRNYWGDLASPDPDLSCSANAIAGKDNGRLIFNPSATPRPLRYRNKF